MPTSSRLRRPPCLDRAERGQAPARRAYWAFARAVVIALFLIVVVPMAMLWLRRPGALASRRRGLMQLKQVSLALRMYSTAYARYPASLADLEAATLLEPGIIDEFAYASDSPVFVYRSTPFRPVKAGESGGRGDYARHDLPEARAVWVEGSDAAIVDERDFQATYGNRLSGVR